MIVLYIETSALVKRYVPEQGSGFIDLLVDHKDPRILLGVTALTTLEVHSVLIRLRKGGALTENGFHYIGERFRQDHVHLATLLPITEGLVARAIALLPQAPLKSLDALHFAAIRDLASAIRSQGETFAVVCSDRDLLDACRRDHIPVLDPQDDGAPGQLASLLQTSAS